MKINLKTLGKINIICMLISSVFTAVLNKSRFNYIFVITSIILIGIFIFFNRKNKLIFPICIIVSFSAYLMLRSVNSLNILVNYSYARVYFLGFLFFISVIIFCDKKTYDLILNALLWLLFPHTLLCFYQLLLTNECDCIGGIFGHVFGASNTCCHMYLLVTSIIIFSKLIYKEISPLMFFIYIILIFISASVGEIKIFYFELIILVLFYGIFSKKYLSTFLLLVISAVLIFYGMMIISTVNPNFNNFMSIDGILSYLDEGYAGKQVAVTRTNGFSFISKYLFEGDLKYIVFGKGFGLSGAIENLAKFFNISYFTYAFTFFRSGIIGCILFYSIFIYLLISNFVKKEKSLYTTISFIMSFFAIVISFYCSELIFVYTTCFIYFCLAGRYIEEN